MQDVVEKSVFFVPQLDFLATDVVHGPADVDEVLEEFAGDVLVRPIFSGQFQRDREHVEAIHAHPTRRIRLFDMPAGRQRRAAVEDPDVIEAQESALEDIFPFGVFPIHPPGEIQEQFVKHALQEDAIAYTLPFLVDLVDAPGRPRMHGRIHISKRPFVGGNLAVWVHVPLTEHQDQLLLGKGRIHQRQRNAVKCEIPCGIPGILPLVRHGDDVGVVKMGPIRVASMEPFSGRFGPSRVALQPPIDVVMVELLAPEEAGKRLPLDAACVFGEIGGCECAVELVGLLNPLRERGIERLVRETLLAIFVRQAKVDGVRCARGQ